MGNDKISLIVQEGKIKSLFPNSFLKRNGEISLVWIHTITPSAISNSYKVKLDYKKGVGVNFYVVDPTLKLAEGKDSLPHVYSNSEQRLCLYYPTSHEWHAGLLFTKTIIPWACEWLYHYEIWVGTGEWHGGGIHPFDQEEVDSSLTLTENNT